MSPVLCIEDVTGRGLSRVLLATVFFFDNPQPTLEPWIYCILCMAVYPLGIYLPTHGLILLLSWRLKGEMK